MTKKRTYSARLKVTLITFIILLVQVLIFYFVFSTIDVVDMLEKATYKYYTRRLDQSESKLESKMIHSYSSDKVIAKFLDDLQYVYLINKDKPENIKVDETVASSLLQSLSNTGASGAFVLLNMDMRHENPNEDIFFVRDNNVNSEYRDNSDISVELGSEKIAKKLNLNLNGNWHPKSNIGKYRAENINKLRDKLRKSFEESEIIDASRLAFWETNIDLMDKDCQNMVYIYPLIDRYTKKLYGMVGIEVNHALIQNILEVNTLSTDYPSGFAIAKNNSLVDEQVDDGSIFIVDYFGSFIQGLSSAKELRFQKAKNEYDEDANKIRDMYVLKNSGISLVNVIPKKINIYSKDSYYYGDDLYLLLLSDEGNFYYDQSDYYNGIIISVVVSIAFAILLSIILSHSLTKPIRVLVKEIENMDVSKKITFETTNIKEMNLLTGRIEQLSYDVGSFYFKMQNMLEIMGRTIVILEEDIGTEIVYKTGRISAMLGEVDLDEAVIEEMTKYKIKKAIQHAIKGRKIEYVLNNSSSPTSVIGITNGTEKLYVKYEQKRLEDKIFHIYMDYTEDYKNIIRLEKEKNYDYLTLLPNRDYFRKLVTKCLEKYPQKKYAMVMWDLDNLKYINDIFGHDLGDAYLKQTADILKTLQGEIVIVSRFSGDEFFAFISYEGEKTAIREKIAKLQNKLLASKLVIRDYEEVKIRASVGLCWYPDDADNYADLYKYSDFAMYQAKHSNKGSIVEFDKNIYEKDSIVLLGKEEFNRLIEQQLVRFAFQPIVSTETAEVFGYEALMRTKSEKINSIDKVMKLAKVQFKLPQIENLTFEGVFNALEKNQEFIQGKKIFINSIASVAVPDEKEHAIKEKLAKYADMIVVEITESEEVNNEALTTKKAYRQKFGSMLAIDDFGSGYSTETTLLKINPDFIKIDMAIIRNIHKDTNKAQLVKNIVDYSKFRGIKIIAEGIEVEDELYALMELGVDYIQGYYLAKPNFDIIDIPKDKKQKMLAIKEAIRRKRT